jgi:Fe2+ transport system protein B
MSPAHGPAVFGPDGPLAAVLLVAGVGSLVVASLAAAALARRRSRSYLLVALALGTLAARTGVAVVSVSGFLAYPTHHLVEHALDAVMAALVVAAVYYARRAERAVGGNNR